MLSIIYPYRDKEIERVKNSFDSLVDQSDQNFEVYFVNYGSTEVCSERIEILCRSYFFIKYLFHSTQHQPWNKSRALNSVIKTLNSDFCFIADIDMIFHPDFVKKASQVQSPEKTVYFQVGFLDPNEEISNKKFTAYRNFRKSTREATGLSMFPVKVLKELRGFDEFYHFWGSEDTDMHVRLQNAGYEIEFYDKEILMLHQWHLSYRSKQKKGLTAHFQIKGIVQLNHQHLKFAGERELTIVNPEGWGEIMPKTITNEFENAPVNITITNEKRQVDDILYGQLPGIREKIFKIIIRTDPFHRSPKYFTKKLLGRKLPVYYKLKEVNDILLLHIISFYRDKPYSYKIDVQNREITMCIKV